MKSMNSIGRIASTLMFLAFFATASFAAINPLANPLRLQHRGRAIAHDSIKPSFLHRGEALAVRRSIL